MESPLCARGSSGNAVPKELRGPHFGDAHYFATATRGGTVTRRAHGRKTSASPRYELTRPRLPLAGVFLSTRRIQVVMPLQHRERGVLFKRRVTTCNNCRSKTQERSIVFQKEEWVVPHLGTNDAAHFLTNPTPGDSWSVDLFSRKELSTLAGIH